MLCSLIKRSLLSDLLFVMLHEITLLISFSCLASCLYFVSAPQLFEVMVLPGHTHGVREELHPRLIYLLRDIDADPSSSWTLVCAPSREERFDGLQLRVDRIVDVKWASLSLQGAAGGTSAAQALRFQAAQQEAARFSIVYTVHTDESLRTLQLECADERERDTFAKKLKKIVGARKSKERRLAKHQWLGSGTTSRWASIEHIPMGTSTGSGKARAQSKRPIASTEDQTAEALGGSKQVGTPSRPS
jgi:hypothetical protein